MTMLENESTKCVLNCVAQHEGYCAAKQLFCVKFKCDAKKNSDLMEVSEDGVLHELRSNAVSAHGENEKLHKENIKLKRELAN